MSTTTDQIAVAKKVLGLIDLTSLNDDDTDADIKSLCATAVTQYGNVAAVCIYSRFVPLAKKVLKNSKIKIATVTNFPHGSHDLDLALFETELAIKRGANEVDIVFPYHELISGHFDIAAKMIKKAKKICGKKILKVIIESGELKTKALIRQAAEISIANGADFIKTSTGKVTVNATLEATKIMLRTIKASGKKCGFKAAGGVKTVEQAAEYLELTANIMGEKWITPKNFRFGASSLLNNVLSILNNNQSEIQTSGY